jgi:retron-type reverse transcriptase
VVDKCLCENVVVPLLSNSLIYDNGASIKGKGVHFALRRLVAHLSRYYRSNGRSNEGYALVVDFSKFFDSINHAILFQLQNRIIKDPRIRRLIYSYVTAFGDGVSLGLGSQVSQISAIFYPSVLDHYIKERLRIKYYGRYMDDLYLIHGDREYLKKCLKEIRRICGLLKIQINEKKTGIVKLSGGINFLKGKYQLLPSGKVLRLPSSDSAKRMKRKLRKFKKLIDEGKMNYEDPRCSYQSWRGNFRRRFNAFHQVRFADKLYFDLFISGKDINASSNLKCEFSL